MCTTSKFMVKSQIGCCISSIFLAVYSWSFSIMLCAQEADLGALPSGFCLSLTNEKQQQLVRRWKGREMRVCIPLVPSLPQRLPGPSLLQLQLSQDSVTTFSSWHFEFIDPLQLLAFLIYLDSAHTLQIVHSLNEPNYQSEVCHLFPARPLSDTSNKAEYYFIKKQILCPCFLPAKLSYPPLYKLSVSQVEQFF